MAFGLGFLLVFQAMINIGVGVNLIPVTGQPPPFTQYGRNINFIYLSISWDYIKRK